MSLATRELAQHAVLSGQVRARTTATEERERARRAVRAGIRGRRRAAPTSHRPGLPDGGRSRARPRSSGSPRCGVPLLLCRLRAGLSRGTQPLRGQTLRSRSAAGVRPSARSGRAKPRAGLRQGPYRRRRARGANRGGVVSTHTRGPALGNARPSAPPSRPLALAGPLLAADLARASYATARRTAQGVPPATPSESLTHRRADTASSLAAHIARPTFAPASTRDSESGIEVAVCSRNRREAEVTARPAGRSLPAQSRSERRP